MKRKRIILAILILLNCITIFYFSHQIADNSSRQSNQIVEMICRMIPSIQEKEETEQIQIKERITPIVRKTAHFSIYAILGIFSVNFMFTIKEKKQYQKVLYAFLFCFFYAITDEFHQSFIPGRSAELRDVLIDSLGALTGILSTILGITINQKRKKEKLG